MKKRTFLNAGVWSAATVITGAGLSDAAAATATPCAATSGPVLLTLTGAIGKGNRGALDPALDQMMFKQKLQFSRAHTFDFAALTALPQQTIKPTLEYDGKPHTLSGPLLTDVLAATGARPGSDALLRAIDGYAVLLPAADAKKYRFIIATHIDGHPLPLGGLGPLWAVYDADRFPDMLERPLAARFALCPWGLYHIEARV